MSAKQGRSPENDAPYIPPIGPLTREQIDHISLTASAAREDLCRHGVPMFYPCVRCVIPPVVPTPENDAPGETCPSLCVERSHPGREHDPATDGCYCWELCAMGPTCPGANAGLERGCWRVIPPAKGNPGGAS